MKKLLFYASAVAVLFSSCSKDATEDVIIKSGNEVFSATILTEDESTTRVTLNGSTYVWDVNDAIGVASEQAPDANIQVSTNVGGVSPKFSVATEDYTRWLEQFDNKDNALFAYFPYKAGTTFTNEGVVTINIPAEQRFAPKSFYKNSIFAVGFAPAYNGAEQELELTVPHSMILANVIGWGDLEEISLEIKTADDKYLPLTGEFDVDVMPGYDTDKNGVRTYKAFTKDELTTKIDPQGQYGNKITVDLGFKPEGLDYTEALPVHFVVPAGINLSEATLVFSDGNGDTYEVKMPKEASDGKMTLRPNLRVTIRPMVQFGLDDKFLIMDDDTYTAEEKFLAYAYLAQVQTADSKPYEGVWDFVKAYVPNASSVYDVDALIVDTELDFAAYDKAWADAAKAELDKKLVYNATNEFWSNVYAWYSKNGGAIESLAYNAVLGDSNTTIKNLNVAGTGLTVAAGLENLTLQNVTVKAKGGNFAGLIAGHSNYAANVKDVVISTGNKVVAENVPQVGGVFGRLANADAIYAAAEPIAIEAKECGVVGRLYGKTLADVELTLADFDWDPSVAAYPVIGEAEAMVNVTADVVVDASMLNAGVVGKVNLQSGWSGSVLVADTYYWNGGFGSYDGSAYDKDGKVTNPLTAEEFASVIRMAINSDLVFTHNFDMQGDHSVLAGDDVDAMAITYPFAMIPYNTNADAKYTVDGKNKTISNITLVSGDVNAHAALFGKEADIKDITVTGLTINTEAAKTGYVAGLAYTGKAKNVTVNNVAINVGGENWLSNDAEHTIGAVFATVNAKDIENVTANNVAIVSGAKASAGLVAGKLVLSGETSELNKIVVTGSNSVAVKDVKSMTVKTAAKLASYVAGTNYAFNAPFGIVNPEDAQFSEGGQVNHTLTVKDCSYGDKLAAGYWIGNKVLDKAKSVAPSKTAYPSTGYGYVFASNANAGNSEPYNNIAFTK